MEYYVSLFLSFALIVVLSTHCFTTARYYIHYHLIDHHNRGKEPLTLPYSLPWVGSAIYMIENPHGFFDHVLSRSLRGAPVRVRLGLLHAYIIHGSSNVQRIFRSSKDLTFEAFALRVMRNAKRLPRKDAAVVGLDKSGSSTKPLSECSDDTRIWRQFHEIFEKNLISNTAVHSMTKRFVEEFQHQINRTMTMDWTTAKINDLLQDIMLRASTQTLAGPGVFEIDPDFGKHFWEYDESFMSLLYGLPRVFCRTGWDARDRSLETVKQYLAKAWDCFDWQACQLTDPDWEPKFGSKLVREREDAMEKYGIELPGRASFQLGLIWSINSNAIPMTSWIIIEILQRPSLYAEIMNELSQAVTMDMESSRRKVNIQSLLTRPLLSSVYQECLRLRASVVIVRELRNNVDFDGYTLKAGNLVMAPSWLAHQDPSDWSTDGYPAHEFWPKRFYGLKKNFEAGSYFPYGGGTAVCPGRYYAKQEILAAVALFLASFDFEFLHFVNKDGSKSSRGPEVGSEARGVARIDRDLLVKMKRRN